MKDETGSEDLHLIRQIIKRDQHALELLYRRHSKRIYQMAYQVTQHHNAAEEITQDVFFQIWRWPERWNPERGQFMSWALTVTRYTAIDYVRRHQRQPTVQPYNEELMQPALKGGPESAFDQAARAEKVQKVLQALPREQRSVILLAFFRGMTHEEIATHTGLPLGTVKSRIRLGMKKLKDALSQNLTKHSSD